MRKFDPGTTQAEMFGKFRDWKYINQLPHIQFPSEWKVKLIPPFGGVAIRFIVGTEKQYVSVFLDMNRALTSEENCVWEIYPAADGDIARFDIMNTEGLMKGIQEALDELRNCS